MPNGTCRGSQGETTSGRVEEATPGFLGGFRELGNGLFRAGAEGIPLAGGIRVHRALPLTALALLLSAVAALAFRWLTPAPDPTVEWYSFGFLDERWLLMAYWLCVASCLFVPLLVTRHLHWEARAGDPELEAARRIALRITAPAVVYVLWLGPPWNLELLQRPMEWHEIVHLGPIQSLLVGKALYLESGSQYGPGLQMFSLHYLEHFGVSLLSFREFWLWSHFVGGLVIVYNSTRWGHLFDPAWMPPGERAPDPTHLFRHALSHPAVDMVLTASETQQQLEENMKALEQGVLSTDETAWLERTGQHVHDLDPNTT